MFFALNSFPFLLFLLIISISHQSIYEPTGTTNRSGGFAMMSQKTDEMLNMVSEFLQQISTIVGENVTTVEQDAIGQNVTKPFGINRLKPHFVEYFCIESIERHSDLLKSFCAQLKVEDKSIEEAAKYVQKTMGNLNFAMDPAIIEEFRQNIPKLFFLSSENIQFLATLFEQFKKANDLLLQMIDSKNCQCAAAALSNDNNTIGGTRSRRRKRANHRGLGCAMFYFFMAVVFLVFAVVCVLLATSTIHFGSPLMIGAGWGIVGVFSAIASGVCGYYGRLYWKNP